MAAAAGFRERVDDFYRCFAPQDAAKASVALSLGLSVENTIDLLSTKHRIPTATARHRSQLLERVARRFQQYPASLNIGDPFQAAFHLLKDVPPTSAVPLDDAAVARMVDRVVTQQQQTGASSLQPLRPLSVVELSPVHADQQQQQQFTTGSGGSSLFVTPTPATRSNEANLPSSFGEFDSSPAAPLPAATSPQPHPFLSQPQSQAVGHRIGSSVASTVTSAVRSYMENHRDAMRLHTPPVALVDAVQRPPGDTDPALRAYHRKLVEVEASLLHWCVELHRVQEAQQRTAAQQDVREQQLKERETSVVSRSEQLTAKFQAKDVEAAEVRAQLDAKMEYCREAAQRLEQDRRHMEQQAATIEERETKLAASLQAVAGREAACAAQLKLIESEKALCQKLSSEVLRREGVVRSVEKQLSAAKVEMARLEDELSGRAKQVVDDEASLRRWATEVEKRELTVQSIFEQLRHKGIHVSF